MTILHLILRNLRFYRKPYLAIFAGVVISTAVLTGALVVGDSVRYSLKQLNEVRLGRTRYTLQSRDRFFMQALAGEMVKQLKIPVAPVLTSEAIAVNPDKNSRINRVQVFGIDERFIHFWGNRIKQPGSDEAILSGNTAEKLQLKTGDEFLIRIMKQSMVPQNAPFVSEKLPSVSVRLKVSLIADDKSMGRFSLKSNQAAPFNIFISLKELSARLELAGLANLLLIGNEGTALSPEKMDSTLKLTWQPADAGLKITKTGQTGRYEITSGRIFIDSKAGDAIKSTLPAHDAILTYLVNSISAKGRSTPYSFATASNGQFSGHSLTGKEIIINNWLADDLKVRAGDSLMLRYFIMGPMRSLKEDSSRFIVKSIFPITNPVFDRSLMPEFPGMSGAGNCRDWETGAPVDLKKIRDKDEQYWQQYRGTPKAFISLEAGQKLWANPFGQYTAFRFAADSNMLPGIEHAIMQKLNPSENGLIFQAVYSEGDRAAANSTDFKGLFLSLSFFIIAAGLLLTALLFSLLANSRMAETGVLSSIGFSRRNIVTILFTEAGVAAIAGAVSGSFAGILYNRIILFGLNTVWQGAIGTSTLQMHIVPITMLTGALLGFFTSLLVLYLVLKRNFRKSLSVLVKGHSVLSNASIKRSTRLSGIIAITLCLAAAVIIAWLLLTSQFSNPEMFLTAGGCLLIGGISLLNYFLLRSSYYKKDSFPSFRSLVLSNAGLKRNRTVAAVALLAIGTFSIIITGANRKTFSDTRSNRQSGTGGFMLWAETTLPIQYGLNSLNGKKQLGIEDEPILDSLQFLQLLRLEGDDASCLNLNQVTQPVMLGINPRVLDRLKAFSFVTLDPGVDKNSPWLSLNHELAAQVIPAYADQTVITWGLGKAVGDTLLFHDEKGRILKVKLMGGLDNSIFQGNLLVSDSLFRLYYPSVSGSKIMLINGPADKQQEVASGLEKIFRDYGMMTTPPSDRLAAFNTVENTYLSVFMMLGGLGVIIGTVGLGIVFLQNINESRQQLALYLAIGYRRQFILKLLLSEYLFILLSGILIGLLSALAGILPSILSPAFQLPRLYLFGILILIFVNGFFWIYFPAKTAMRRNLVRSLREE